MAEDQQEPDDRARVPGQEPVGDVVAAGGGAIVVRLAGEIDLHNAHVVRVALLDALREAPPRLVVDLADVTFLDSTALGVLIETRAKLGDGRSFVLASPGLAARRALEVSGLDRHFTICGSVAEALGRTP